ncbi:endonuclease MutS2 [Thermococcus sp.]|uniref:endonuclease MutS2 n=1 Tax=Thermococcus sp. TaxID=35749 RepID=UPI0026355856|nr:endonuclease MutS2 [Thermococcus sp.]
MRLRMNTEARTLYRAILGEIKKRLVLKGSEEHLGRVAPTSDPEEILSRQAYFRENLPRLSPSLRKPLERVKPIRFPKDYLHDRVLLVDESEVGEAKKLGLCDVTTDVEEARSYPLVLSTVGYGIDVELKPLHIAPELYVLPLWDSRDTLEALAEIGYTTGRGSVARKILASLEDFGETAGREQSFESLDELVAEKERELNEKISERLEKFSLTLTGKELFEFLAELKGGNYEAIFRRFSGVEGEILGLIDEAERELSEKLGLTVELFPRDELYPLHVPPERIEELRAYLEGELALERYLKAREIAEKVVPLIPALREELRRANELDFLLAVKDFTRDFSFPELGSGGVAFIRARHIFIENPQPVSYAVGGLPDGFTGPGNPGDAEVVVLTGANSGGKTSLLELISQVVILTHMGLPVPAERAWVEPLDELFFFRRKRSTYGAGAFETALRSFVRALRGLGRKLILIDEFEAITEPGAAVKIIGELLKVAHERGFHVVIVSHLGEELREELPFARVDGIEAKGLDENLNLIVDRQPVFGKLGRSTPELIVERLARKARGRERELYERVLSAFRE